MSKGLAVVAVGGNALITDKAHQSTRDRESDSVAGSVGGDRAWVTFW